MDHSGASLSGAFYSDAVRALVTGRFPTLPHCAARLGSGSDVLGFDDRRSRDHDWGCRLTLLLEAGDEAVVAGVDAMLEAELPETFGGHPVRFPTTWDPRSRHKVEVATLPTFVTSRLGLDATGAMEPIDWLVLTGQSVLEVVGGPVFADPLGSLEAARDKLKWYPQEVWLYVLAAGWSRLSQELPFVGRTGELGDESGSRMIAARLGRDIVHLAFLIERRWSPYPKWAGRALGESAVGRRLQPAMERALGASGWQGRQQGLSEAIGVLHEAQASRGLPTAKPPVQAFFDRPFLIANPESAAVLSAGIHDPFLRMLPPGIGSVEQWIDNVDVLSHPLRRVATREAYRAFAPPA